MARLTGGKLAFFAEHLEEIKKAYKTQIYLCFDDAGNGFKAYLILKELFGSDLNYEAYGSDWRDYYVGFTSQAKRNEAYDELSNDIGTYLAAEFEEEYKEDEDEEETPPPPTPPTPEEPKPEQPDYTTYIIIGAAAIVIVLLLWKK